MDIALIITLIIAGIVLLLLEIMVIPGVGVAGIIGLGTLVGACVLAFRINAMTGYILTAAIVLLLIALLCYVLREQTWKRATLNTTVKGSAGQNASIVAVGDTGVTLTRLAPMGTARIDDKNVEVKSFEGFLDPGTKVIVFMIEENIIYVNKL